MVGRSTGSENLKKKKMCLNGWNTFRERLTWNKSSLDLIFKAVGRLKDFKQGSDVG